LTEPFARSHRDIIAEVERSARDHGAKLLRTLGASIDTWFLSSQSLEWLVQDLWTPLVNDYRQACLEAAAKAFAQAGAQINAGLDLPDGISELTRRAGIDLRLMRARSLDSLGQVAWPKHAVVPVDVRTIPVKKGVVDRLTFRSLDKVRTRIFGAFDKPDIKVPGKDKAKYLGEPGRLHLHQCVAQFRGTLLPQTTGSIGYHFGARFMEVADKMLREHLSEYAPRLTEKLASIESERTYLMSVASPLRDLSALTSGTKKQLDELATKFVHDADFTPQTKIVGSNPKAPQQPAKQDTKPENRGESNG